MMAGNGNHPKAVWNVWFCNLYKLKWVHHPACLGRDVYRKLGAAVAIVGMWLLESRSDAKKMKNMASWKIPNRCIYIIIYIYMFIYIYILCMVTGVTCFFLCFSWYFFKRIFSVFFWFACIFFSCFFCQGSVCVFAPCCFSCFLCGLLVLLWVAKKY